ncbi:hypothetical protein SEVIR_9G301200v4 [Setaria viridis]
MTQASSSISIVLFLLALAFVVEVSAGGFYKPAGAEGSVPIERKESSLLSTLHSVHQTRLRFLLKKFEMRLQNKFLRIKRQCPDKCDYRCSATSHKKPCLFFCNYCCQKCLCVPSGTYGNKEECPCYNNMKNKEGGPKCP